MIIDNTIVASFLILFAIILLIAVQFGLVSDHLLQRLTNVAGTVAALAAILIFVIPAADTTHSTTTMPTIAATELSTVTSLPNTPVLPTLTNTPTAVPIATQTEISVPPTAPPTATAAEPAVATATAAPSVTSAELVLGVTKENPECLFFTDVVKQITEGELGLTVAKVDYMTSADMYAALAARQEQRTADLTLCFTDPKDRSFLREYFGFIRPLGDVWGNDGMQLQIVSNSGLLTELEREQVCLYRLLKNLDFTGNDLPKQNPTQWVLENAELVDRWASCELLP
jgi:hypothetical protein